MHVCTEEEFSRFYPPAVATKKNLKLMKNSIMCRDKLDKDGKEFPHIIFGVTGTDSRT